MQTEIVTFPASDGHGIDGLLYEPPGVDREPKQGRLALVISHGRAMDFCVGAPRFLPPALVPLGYTCLSINRRGHAVIAMGNRFGPSDGAAYEVFEDSQRDVDGAVAFLRERGYERIGVMGHSYGAATSGYYAATHPETAVAVLLSCSQGGPDMLRRQSAAGRMAMDRHDEFEAKARQLVAEGKGDQLMFVPGWWHVITAYSFLNQGLPVLFEYAPKITCPLLALRGEREDPEGVPEKRTAELAGGRARSVVIPGADHFYGGQEDLVAEAVIDFLRWAER